MTRTVRAGETVFDVDAAEAGGAMPDPLGDLAFTWPFYAIAALVIYGSVPSGLLLTRVAGLGDIRTIGSGNIGATACAHR